MRCDSKRRGLQFFSFSPLPFWKQGPLDGIAFCCFIELGQKFSFPVKTAKESNTRAGVSGAVPEPPWGHWPLPLGTSSLCAPGAAQTMKLRRM